MLLVGYHHLMRAWCPSYWGRVVRAVVEVGPPRKFHGVHSCSSADDHLVFIALIMTTIMLVSAEHPNYKPSPKSFHGEWLAGTSSVTSVEGHDVTILCIFKGRSVWNKILQYFKLLNTHAWNKSSNRPTHLYRWVGLLEQMSCTLSLSNSYHHA